MNKTDVFEIEINYILNPEIREFARMAVVSLPDYFFSIPASSTGRYHPNYALGDGGLVRHTKAAIRIFLELLRTELWKLTEDEKDLVIAGLLVHDGYKSGIIQEQYTRTDHPNLIVHQILENDELLSFLKESEIQFLTSNIASHMGRWCFDYKTNEEILEKPKTIAQKLFHLSDYLASRKCLDFNFDIVVKREE